MAKLNIRLPKRFLKIFRTLRYESTFDQPARTRSSTLPSVSAKQGSPAFRRPSYSTIITPRIITQCPGNVHT